MTPLPSAVAPGLKQQVDKASSLIATAKMV